MCCFQAQKRQSINETSETSSHNKTESPETSGSAHAQINIPTPQVDSTPEKGSEFHLNDNNGTPSENPVIQTINKQQKDFEKENDQTKLREREGVETWNRTLIPLRHFISSFNGFSHFEPIVYKGLSTPATNKIIRFSFQCHKGKLNLSRWLPTVELGISISDLSS